MFPEEVYNCKFDLPYELLRPIAFYVAYSHIKEKLRFPESYYGFHGVVLFIIRNDEKSIYFHWYSPTEEEHVTAFIHREYPDYAVHERKYYSSFNNDRHYSSVSITVPSSVLIKFTSHLI